MDKIKAFLTQKLNKDSFKDAKVIRAIKLTLCGALIFALMIQAISCICAPLLAYAAEDDSIVGTWLLKNDGQNFTGTGITNSYTNSEIEGSFYSASSNGNYSSVSSYDISFALVSDTGIAFHYDGGTYNHAVVACYSSRNYITFYRQTSSQFTTMGTNNSSLSEENKTLIRTITITKGNDATILSWLKANSVQQVDEVYDFTGETRIFNSQLTTFSHPYPTETNVYNFNFNVWQGANADAMVIQETSDQSTLSYSFSDDGAGGLRTVYRQSFDGTTVTKTWIYPRTRVITFQSNPDDPDFQQWLLDNTQLVDLDSMAIGYDTGYDIGFNNGWTNSAIGDTLKAPVDALNNIVLLETAGVTITLGGVIFTMVILSIMLIFLKKYAGG